MSRAYMRRCAGKRRHETKDEAYQERDRKAASAGISRSRLVAYHCDQCGGWHVGGTGKVHASRVRRAGKRANKRMRGR